MLENLIYFTFCKVFATEIFSHVKIKRTQLKIKIMRVLSSKFICLKLFYFSFKFKKFKSLCNKMPFFLFSQFSGDCGCTNSFMNTLTFSLNWWSNMIRVQLSFQQKENSFLKYRFTIFL